MEILRSWTCSDCGRSNVVVTAFDAAGRCEDCADLNTSDDATKGQVLGRLRDRYLEARNLVSSRRSYTNLEWVLAAMRNPDRTASYWADRTIDLVAVWLEDLAADIERLFPQEVTGEIAEGALSAYRAHRFLAKDLRDATEGFVLAFRHSARPVDRELPAQRVADSVSLGISAVSSRATYTHSETPFLSQESGLAFSDLGKNQRLSPDIAVSHGSLTRDSGLEPSLCVMCDHERATHTVGTDGAGWCGEERGCECGGFQGWRSGRFRCSSS
jgi:hypothetical protein